jgi:Zn-dependent peptidase ImmA (M78 family)
VNVPRHIVEANWFAVGFLVPEDFLREKKSLGWSNAEIAEALDVGEHVVADRIETLGGEQIFKKP